MKNVYEKLFEFRKLTGKVAKGSNNPFFKSKYADLNSVIEATDFALEEVGLVYVDRIDNMNLVSEIVDYESGEKIENITPLILTKNDMQQLGSAVTYARRYARMAMCGLMAVDDDGNFVAGHTQNKPPIQKVSAQDAGLIKELLIGTNTDEATFLGYYKVGKVSDLTQPNATDAIQKLTKKKDAA